MADTPLKFTFQCSSCSRTHRVEIESIGRKATCSCGLKFKVPAPKEIKKTDLLVENIALKSNIVAPVRKASHAVARPKRTKKTTYSAQNRRSKLSKASHSNQHKKSKSLILLSLIVLMIGAGLVFYDINRDQETSLSVENTADVDSNGPKTPLKIGLVSLPAHALPSVKVAGTDLEVEVDRIDELVLQKLNEQGIAPNQTIIDSVFLRRTYLSLAGRIPSHDEILVFENNNSQHRRSELIDQLIGSEAYVSHQFNYWADILRLGGYMGIANATYKIWLKDTLTNNTPYDQFVRELVGAQGFIWENGATGYYVRDRGMPLDNMANTVRIFLGTRLECAQCHDHPTDKWTQKEFYEMASFTHDIYSEQYPKKSETNAHRFTKEKRVLETKEKLGHEKFPTDGKQHWLNIKKSNPNFYNHAVKKVALDEKDFLEKLDIVDEMRKTWKIEDRLYRDGWNRAYGYKWIHVSQRGADIKLPHDYQYDDAEAEDIIDPKTIFPSQELKTQLASRDLKSYAKWMTSKDIPRFSQLIANRMWKQAFGIGILDPVDKVKTHSSISNIPLYEYLGELIHRLGYDLQAFQNIIYNTRAWQRAMTTQEIVMGDAYYFQGPLLKRMSAEQLWDSLVSLAIPNTDNYHPHLQREVEMITSNRNRYEYFENLDTEKFIDMARQVGLVKKNTDIEVNELRDKELIAFQNKKFKEVQELKQLKIRSMQDAGREISALMGIPKNNLTDNSNQMMKSMNSGMMSSYALDTKELNQKQKYNDKVFGKWVGSFARASELHAPESRSHMLRLFGQSDRLIIQNSSLSSTIPQALTLLNSNMIDVLSHDESILGQSISHIKSKKLKLVAIFKSLLAREPSERELEMFLKATESYSEDEAERLVLWTVLNSKKFLFIL